MLVSGRVRGLEQILGRIRVVVYNQRGQRWVAQNSLAGKEDGIAVAWVLPAKESIPINGYSSTRSRAIVVIKSGIDRRFKKCIPASGMQMATSG
jgi:SH3-like domain-containing protein